MLRRLYDWTMKQAEGPRAMPALMGVSFADSSFFPIPPDVLMVPMALARPERAWWIATMTLLASVAGAFFGYWIGAALFESVGRKLLNLYGAAEKFEEFKEFYGRNGVWAVILFGGLTPFPFKVITITSGAMGMNLFDFFWASLLARSMRFYVVCALIWKFGEPIKAFIEKRLTLVATVFTVMLIGGFVALKSFTGGG